MDGFALAASSAFEPCMDTVMDDEKVLINTKGLSLQLHPNLAEHVCAVSQRPETAE